MTPAAGLLALLLLFPGAAPAAAPVPASVPAAASAWLRLRAPNAPEPLATPIPYEGGELVHPSVFFQPGGWNGYPYWMAVTPYAHSDARLENPSLYCSLDGRTWITPPGIRNPLVPPPELPRRYNSDCHLAMGPDGLLRLIYRSAGADRNDTLHLISSRDGRRWSRPRTILDVDLADERQLSPAVFWDGARWNLYYVDSSAYPYRVRRRTAPEAQGPWSDPQEVQGLGVPEDRMFWHLDAFRREETTLLLLDTTAASRTSTAGQLILASSRDGLTFTQAREPLLTFSAGWDRSIYRSCALPLPQAGGPALAIWYSAWGPDLGWRLGYTEARVPAGPRP